jgi:hypothetical protein
VIIRMFSELELVIQSGPTYTLAVVAGLAVYLILIWKWEKVDAVLHRH